MFFCYPLIFSDAWRSWHRFRFSSVGVLQAFDSLSEGLLAFSLLSLFSQRRSCMSSSDRLTHTYVAN